MVIPFQEYPGDQDVPSCDCKLQESIQVAVAQPQIPTIRNWAKYQWPLPYVGLNSLLLSRNTFHRATYKKKFIRVLEGRKLKVEGLHVERTVLLAGVSCGLWIMWRDRTSMPEGPCLHDKATRSLTN